MNYRHSNGFSLGYNFNPSNIATLPNKILTYHRIIEAFKFAFAKRSRLADANFVDVREVSYTNVKVIVNVL